LRKSEIAVLRWGHRYRDQRVTTHVALVARAFGADRFILSDVTDQAVKMTVEKIANNWGGRFDFEMGQPWRQTVEEWRSRGAIVVHLTAYGENIETSRVINRIRAAGKNILIIVGSQKVPREFFSPEISDFNVAIGNQPHSEVSSLAIFLDRLLQGKELAVDFSQARLKILPQKHGKKVIKPRNPSIWEQQI
jgi:tRNA (cytidine56-2'-O)-methyltransferase